MFRRRKACSYVVVEATLVSNDDSLSQINLDYYM